MSAYESEWQYVFVPSHFDRLRELMRHYRFCSDIFQDAPYAVQQFVTNDVSLVAAVCKSLS